jgi:hypothetical protein
MTSQKRVAHLILLSTLAVSATLPVHAQRWNSNTRQTYTPPPAPRPVMRPEPQQQYQTETRQVYQPRVQQDTRQSYTPRSFTPETHQQNSRVETSHDSDVRHPSVNVSRSVRINPDYFASHYGREHGFHFNGWGPGCPTCGFTLVNSRWYFNWNGGYFHVLNPFPSSWALASDYLYIDIGDDGNYYLYDAQFPGVAVQLTFVQNPADDQDDQDQGDGQ